MNTSRPALRFDRVTKTFTHQAGRQFIRELLREMLKQGPRGRFNALEDVTFELAPGESLGLMGPNGAGKSTLLNLATGLSRADSGTLEVRGRVAPLLELGAGFHPDLTGVENLKINAALMGLSRAQTEARFEEIVEFAGVGAFIDDALRTYSAGMVVRLAFSVAVHTDPDILLIDEVIGVGDQAFHARCLEKIRALQREGKTMVIASHSMDLLTRLCQKGLWLNQGRVVELGSVAQVAAAYQAGASAFSPAVARSQTSPSP